MEDEEFYKEQPNHQYFNASAFWFLISLQFFNRGKSFLFKETPQAVIQKVFQTPLNSLKDFDLDLLLEVNEKFCGKKPSLDDYLAELEKDLIEISLENSEKILKIENDLQTEYDFFNNYYQNKDEKHKTAFIDYFHPLSSEEKNYIEIFRENPKVTKTSSKTKNSSLNIASNNDNSSIACLVCQDEDVAEDNFIVFCSVILIFL